MLTNVLYFAGTNTLTKVIRALHEGSIFAMCVLKDGTIMTGGGKDGRIVHLDTSLSIIRSEAQVGLKHLIYDYLFKSRLYIQI